jgi:hypothetical protein
MAQLVIDNMNNAGFWSALEPDGVTPSTELTLTADATRFRFGADQQSGRISGTANALDHRLQRGLANLDLTGFDELRFWLWSDRLADGAAGRPFFLEARLGSAALPIDNVGNTWSRTLPVGQARTWELVRLSLDDLPAAVRSSANQLQLRCSDDTAGFTCNLDDLLAVREQMLTDVDNALVARLHNQLTLNGNQVAAVLFHAEQQPVVQQPYIQIKQYDVQYVGERTPVVQTRADYSANGLSLRPLSIAYDIFYELDFLAQSRAEKTMIMEFVLRRLSPRSELLVNAVPLTLDWVPVPPYDQSGGLRDRSLLYFKVATRQEVGAAQPVRLPSTITIDVEHV